MVPDVDLALSFHSKQRSSPNNTGNTRSILHAGLRHARRLGDTLIRGCQRDRKCSESVPDHELGFYRGQCSTICMVDQVDQSILLLLP